jgi:preprotein translocase subunit Sec61beta
MANGAKESAIRRAQNKSSGRGNNHSGSSSAGASGKRGNPGEMRLYTEDSPGFQIGPSAVLLISLSFMAVVVILHIVGKLRS